MSGSTSSDDDAVMEDDRFHLFLDDVDGDDVDVDEENDFEGGIDDDDDEDDDTSTDDEESSARFRSLRRNVDLEDDDDDFIEEDDDDLVIFRHSNISNFLNCYLIMI